MTDLFEVRHEVPTRRLSLWSALRRLSTSRRFTADDARTVRLRRLSEVHAVLEEARTLVEQGWVQNRWYACAPGPRPAGGDTGDDAGMAACLVGAVVTATRRRDPAATVADAGPAIDVLWDAWQETRGYGGPGVAGRAAPWSLRLARVRDLTRWNDQGGRTADEVVALLDLAIGRAIMTAMREPAGRAPVSAG